MTKVVTIQKKYPGYIPLSHGLPGMNRNCAEQSRGDLNQSLPQSYITMKHLQKLVWVCERACSRPQGARCAHMHLARVLCCRAGHHSRAAGWTAAAAAAAAAPVWVPRLGARDCPGTDACVAAQAMSSSRQRTTRRRFRPGQGFQGNGFGNRGEHDQGKGWISCKICMQTSTTTTRRC